MTRAFGEIRSAIHSGHTLPDDWRDDPTIRRYVLDCLRGRKLPIIGADTFDALWRDAEVITVGPITYAGDDLERLRHWLVSWALEEAVIKHWQPVQPNDERPMNAVRARRAYALGQIDGVALSKARSAALSAARSAPGQRGSGAAGAPAVADANGAARNAAHVAASGIDIRWFPEAWREVVSAAHATIHAQAIARLTTLEYEHALLTTT